MMLTGTVSGGYKNYLKVNYTMTEENIEEYKQRIAELEKQLEQNKNK